MSTTFNQLDDCVHFTIFWADDKTNNKQKTTNERIGNHQLLLSFEKKVHLCSLFRLMYLNRMRAAWFSAILMVFSIVYSHLKKTVGCWLLALHANKATFNGIYTHFDKLPFLLISFQARSLQQWNVKRVLLLPFWWTFFSLFGRNDSVKKYLMCEMQLVYISLNSICLCQN